MENTKDLRRLHQHPASAWAPYGVALAAFLVSFLLRQALEQAARFVVRDANGQQLGYFYFEEEPDGVRPPICSRKTRCGGSRPTGKAARPTSKDMIYCRRLATAREDAVTKKDKSKKAKKLIKKAKKMMKKAKKEMKKAKKKEKGSNTKVDRQDAPPPSPFST